MKDKLATYGQRVYEYEDENGVRYYSFTKQGGMALAPVRLRLKSRIGTHLINFLTKLRVLGDRLTRENG
jgi:hypothetical protein